jgi:hypothetical protein
MPGREVCWGWAIKRADLPEFSTLGVLVSPCTYACIYSAKQHPRLDDNKFRNYLATRKLALLLVLHC